MLGGAEWLLEAGGGGLPDGEKAVGQPAPSDGMQAIEALPHCDGDSRGLALTGEPGQFPIAARIVRLSGHL